MIRTLPSGELARLLVHVRDWNTNARTSGVAQGVLHAVLKLRAAGDIMHAFEESPSQTDANHFGNGEEKNGDYDAAPVNRQIVKKTNIGLTPAITLRELIDGMLPYSERHLARADKLVQDSFVVDYILGEMDMGMLADDLDDLGMTMEVDFKA